MARNSENLGDFLQKLSRAHEIFGVDTLSHLAKMVAFMGGVKVEEPSQKVYMSLPRMPVGRHDPAINRKNTCSVLYS